MDVEVEWLKPVTAAAILIVRVRGESIQDAPKEFKSEAEHCEHLSELSNGFQIFHIDLEDSCAEECAASTRIEYSIFDVRRGSHKKYSSYVSETLSDVFQCIQNNFSPATTIFAISNEVHPSIVKPLIKYRLRNASKGTIKYYLLPLSAVSSLEERPKYGFTQIPWEDFRFDDSIKENVRRREGPILIVGETGTGKTETSFEMHKAFRPNGRLFCVNCATLKGDDRDVFFRGVNKKYFSNVGESDSVFVENSGGTLLLDDFQELSNDQQASLLDLVHHATNLVRGSRVGEKSDQWKADVQVIFAINRPVSELVREGMLRPDINYRVQRRIRLEPLREVLRKQGEDSKGAFLRLRILSMQEKAVKFQMMSIGAFARKFNLTKDPATDDYSIHNLIDFWSIPLTNQALDYSWPGNFRTLDNLSRLLLVDYPICGWSDSAFAETFKAVLDDEIPTGPDEAISNDVITKNPRRLMSLAYYYSICRTGATVSQIARDLSSDRRTIKRFLTRILSNDNASLLEKFDFSDQEVNEIVESSERLLG